MKILKATRLQSWIRRLQALFKLKKLRLDRTKSLTLVKLKAIKITNTCRIRIARKELKRRQRLHRSAIKIQKRVRIWIAKKIVKYKIIRRDAAIIIQTRMRVCLAKSFVIRMKAKAEADISAICAGKPTENILYELNTLRINRHIKMVHPEISIKLIHKSNMASITSESSLVKAVAEVDLSRQIELNAQETASSTIGNKYNQSLSELKAAGSIKQVALADIEREAICIGMAKLAKGSLMGIFRKHGLEDKVKTHIADAFNHYFYALGKNYTPLIVSKSPISTCINRKRK
jgi:hypothetical protein